MAHYSRVGRWDYSMLMTIRTLLKCSNYLLKQKVPVWPLLGLLLTTSYCHLPPCGHGGRPLTCSLPRLWPSHTTVCFFVCKGKTKQCDKECQSCISSLTNRLMDSMHFNTTFTVYNTQQTLHTITVKKVNQL